MSYLKDDGNPISDPFAQVGTTGTGTFYFRTGSVSRWDYTSQDWVNENVGDNGLAFYGKGFIWAQATASSNSITCYQINDGKNDRHQSASCFNGAVGGRATNDDTTISYSNTTEILITNEYYSSTSFNKQKSRCGIIRMER